LDFSAVVQNYNGFDTFGIVGPDDIGNILYNASTGVIRNTVGIKPDDYDPNSFPEVVRDSDGNLIRASSTVYLAISNSVIFNHGVIENLDTGYAFGNVDDIEVFLLNTGVISSAGDTAIILNKGDDTVVLGTGSQINGAIDGGDGDDTVYLVSDVSTFGANLRV
jgi:hypothetical protein